MSKLNTDESKFKSNLEEYLWLMFNWHGLTTELGIWILASFHFNLSEPQLTLKQKIIIENFILII